MGHCILPSTININGLFIYYLNNSCRSLRALSYRLNQGEPPEDGEMNDMTVEERKEEERKQIVAKVKKLKNLEKVGGQKKVKKVKKVKKSPKS